MKKLVFGIILTATAAGNARAVNVATFLEKGKQLEAQGPAAMFSAEGRTLQAELQESAMAVRRERLLALRSGRAPSYCPPEGASLSQQEVQAALLAVPVARRAATDVRDVIRAAYGRKYPCRR